MSLARVALYEKGVSLYLAPNTNDNPEWQDTIKHIAIEGHCYFINANQYFTRDMYRFLAIPIATIICTFVMIIILGIAKLLIHLSF